MKHTRILRPIGAALEDAYTRAELLDACERQLFAKARRMDVPLLLELLRALDDRPDEEVAPHRDAIWEAVCRGIRPAAARARVARRRASLAIALILLLLMLAGGCLAWAIRAGVVSFPSLALPWLPSSASPEAQTLVRRDLFSARYEHCELRVLEAAYDGHQICIVYSLTDTRPHPVLNEQDLWSASIPAARLDGIGCCDCLTVDGRDVFLSDTYQLFGERPGEVLYYLAAPVDFTPPGRGNGANAAGPAKPANRAALSGRCDLYTGYARGPGIRPVRRARGRHLGQYANCAAAGRLLPLARPD